MARVDGGAAPVVAVAAPVVGAGVPAGVEVDGGATSVNSVDPASRRMLPFFFAIIGVVGFRLHELVPLVRSMHPAIVLTAVSSIAILASVPTERLRVLTRDPVSKMVLLYLAWALCTIPTSLWKSQSLDTFTGMAFPVIVIFAIVAVIKPSTKILDTMHAGYVACTVLLVLETAAFGTFYGDRLSTGATLDSNDLASITAIGFPLALMLAIRRRGLARVLGILGVVVLLFGLGKFNSRGGTLAFAASALVLMLFQPGVRKLQLLTLMVIAGAAFWTTAPDDYRQRILGMNDLESDYNYTSYYGRKAIWERARGYIVQNPVFGVGMGAFPVAEGQNLQSSSKTGKWSVAHNAYLQAGAEMGIPGMTLFVLMLGAAGRGALRASRRKSNRPDLRPRPEYVASLVGFASGAYFLSHAYFFPMFALLALCSYAIRVADAESASGVGIALGAGGAIPPPGLRVRPLQQGT